MLRRARSKFHLLLSRQVASEIAYQTCHKPLIQQLLNPVDTEKLGRPFMLRDNVFSARAKTFNLDMKRCVEYHVLWTHVLIDSTIGVSSDPIVVGSQDDINIEGGVEGKRITIQQSHYDYEIVAFVAVKATKKRK